MASLRSGARRALRPILGRLDSIGSQLEEARARLASMDGRLEEISARLDGVEDQLESALGRAGTQEELSAGIREAQGRTARRLGEIERLLGGTAGDP